jgi:hypothetical protein
VQEAARAIGLQIGVLNASTSREIDEAFATFVRERPDALFVTGDAFFNSRRVQLANLAARDRIPAAYTNRETVAAGGLMSFVRQRAGGGGHPPRRTQTNSNRPRIALSHGHPPPIADAPKMLTEPLSPGNAGE